MRIERRNRTGWIVLGAVLFSGACSNNGDDGFNPNPDRIISVGVYIDGYHNCDGAPNGSPDVCEGVGAARIALLGPTGTDTLKTVSTQTSGSSKGIGVFHDVEPGTYRVTVAASTLADSLQVEEMELRQQSGSGWLPGVPVSDFDVTVSDDVIYVNLRLGYTAAASPAARLSSLVARSN